MSYKIKLKFISRNKKPVPNIYFEAGIGRTIFIKGYSNSKTGESGVFEARGTATSIKVSKEPNNTINLVNLQNIEHNRLDRNKVNEITIIVPVTFISLLLEKDKDGTYERNLNNTGTHIVKKGESLEIIAKKYNLDVGDLAKRNGISDKNKIQVGQTLNIKGVKNAQEKAISPQIIYPSIVFHIVQKGDSLSSISNKYNVSIEEIKTINSLSGNKVALNQKLFIKQIDKSKDRERQLANLVRLFLIAEASQRTRRPVTTLEPQGTQQFYISISGQLAAVLGVGGSLQLGVATDIRGNVGIFATVSREVVYAGTPGFAIDGGVTLTNAKDIRELRGKGYTMGAQAHTLVGGSISGGYSETKDIETGEDKVITSGSANWGLGVGSKYSVGEGYTFVIPILSVGKK